MTFLQAVQHAQDHGGRYRLRGSVDYEVYVNRGIVMLRAYDRRRRAFREEIGCPCKVDYLLGDWEQVDTARPGSRITLEDLIG